MGSSRWPAPIPATVYLPPRLLAHAYSDLVTRLNLPFVLKTVAGGGGHGTSLVSSEGTFSERLRDEEHARVGFLAQELVPPNGSYFLLVLGGQVALVTQYHSARAADILARQDGNEAMLVDVYSVDQTAHTTAVQAAAALEYDVAGVHLLRHWTTGQWCVLDVTPNPPIGSGGYTAAKVSAYAAYLGRRLTHADQQPFDRLSLPWAQPHGR